jgi:integrase
VDVFRRLHSRQRDLDNVSFDDIFTERCTKQVFRFSTGYQPPNLNGAFGRLMRDSGLLRDIDGKKRTLYSLRHTYATLALLTGDVDIHTLARQMGNSVLMLERHYSKLTATMAAERLA